MNNLQSKDILLGKIASECLFQMLRFAIGASDESPNGISSEEWMRLYEIAQQQSLLSVLFYGIEKHPEMRPPRELLLKWYAISEQIKRRNVLMNKRCVELVEMLKKDGFECCVLKGQGNTVMYPESYSRMSGDIDVFVMPVGDFNLNLNPNFNCSIGIEQRRKVVMEYVKRRFPQAKIRYQHIDYPVFSDVEVEMHFIPTAKNNPIYNRRLQRWVEERMAEQCRHFVELPDGAGRIPVPTVEFNVVYQLSHLMHHFFDEGIGLRQMMDYYFIIRNEELGMRNYENELRNLGLRKFAGAVIWVLHKVFGLEEEYYIVPADEWRGKLLLDEILRGATSDIFQG